MHQVSVATVYNYVERFQAEGIEGLPNKPIPGRPRKATPEYIQWLEETLERDPQEIGFAFTVWTQARLRAYLLEQTGISLSRARFQKLMQALGYVYRRPKYDVVHQQDTELRQQVIDTLDELKKEPTQARSNYSLWMKL
jgi:transposase